MVESIRNYEVTASLGRACEKCSPQKPTTSEKETYRFRDAPSGSPNRLLTAYSAGHIY